MTRYDIGFGDFGPNSREGFNGYLTIRDGGGVDVVQPVHQTNPPEPPPVPIAPILTPVAGGFIVRWDGGFTNTVPPPKSLRAIEVHVGTSETFTVSTLDSLVSEFRAIEAQTLKLSYADTRPRWVCLVARDERGVRGAASTKVGVTPQPLSQVNIGADLGRFANSVITYAAAPPAGPGLLHVHFDTDFTPAKPFYWDGVAWVEITAAAEITALENSLLAISERNRLAAVAAQGSANGKNRNYYQPEMPAGTAYAVGDNWFDSDGGYALHTWDSAKWVPAPLGHQAIATLDMGKATVGELDGIRIKTQTLSTRHLMVGSFDNLVQDPSFSMASLADGPHTAAPQGVAIDYFTPAAGVARSGTQVLRLSPANAADAVAAVFNGKGAPGSYFAASAGDRIYAEAWVRLSAAAATQRAQMRVQWLTATGAHISLTDGALISPVDTGWTKISVTSGEAPPGAVYGRVVPILRAAPDGSYPTTAIYLEDVYSRRMVDGSIVVDGSVSAKKLSTGTLLAGQMITVGAEGGRRIELDDKGLRMYSDATAVQMHLNLGTGSAFLRGRIEAEEGYFKGELSGASMLISGLLRTGTQGNRVEIGGSLFDRVALYSGGAGETIAGAVLINTSTAGHELHVRSPSFGAAGTYPISQLRLRPKIGTTQTSLAGLTADSINITSPSISIGDTESTVSLNANVQVAGPLRSTGQFNGDTHVIAFRGHALQTHIGDVYGMAGIYSPNATMQFGTEGGRGWSWRTGNVEKMWLDGSGRLIVGIGRNVAGVDWPSAAMEVIDGHMPRIAFHQPGQVASQIGQDNDRETIRTFNNPGSYYADFHASQIVGFRPDQGAGATALVSVTTGTSRDAGVRMRENAGGVQSLIKIHGANGNPIEHRTGTDAGFCDSKALTHVNMSDPRLKGPMTEMGSGFLKQIRAVKTYRYDFLPADNNPIRERIGVDATALPDLVKVPSFDSRDGVTVIYGVDSAAMNAFLLGALKELTAKLDALESAMNRPSSDSTPGPNWSVPVDKRGLVLNAA